MQNYSYIKIISLLILIIILYSLGNVVVENPNGFNVLIKAASIHLIFAGLIFFVTYVYTQKLEKINTVKHDDNFIDNFVNIIFSIASFFVFILFGLGITSYL